MYYPEQINIDGVVTDVITSALYFRDDVRRKTYYPQTDFVYVKLAGELVLAPEMVHNVFVLCLIQFRLRNGLSLHTAQIGIQL